jgi:hypothetical protein
VEQRFSPHFPHRRDTAGAGLAGGGVKGGVVYGETDDFSYNIVRDPVSLHDVNATLLHCLGVESARVVRGTLT